MKSYQMPEQVKLVHLFLSEFLDESEPIESLTADGQSWITHVISCLMDVYVGCLLEVDNSKDVGTCYTDFSLSLVLGR